MKDPNRNTKRKQMSSHLEETIKKKLNKRSLRVRTGDKVKIMRGKFKGKIGQVEKVNIKKQRVIIDQAKIEKRDGSKKGYPIHPSNLMILSLKEDKKR